jgi:hypothetical protein
MKLNFRFLLSITITAFLAIMLVSSVEAARGGGGGGVRSSGATSVNHGGGQNRNNNGNRNNNVNNNVNRNNNTNINRNTNVNRNTNINVDVDNNYRGGCCYHDNYHPVATAAAITATAMIVGSIVYSLPPSCSTVVINGFAYQQCGNTWYQPQISGSSTTYVVVNAP